MQIRIRHAPGALLVRPQGDMTAPAAEDLLVQVRKELDGAPRDVVLNLVGVSSMDAGALPLVFRLQRETGRHGRFVIAAVPENVRRFFDATRVSANLALVEREEDALQDTLT